MTSRPVTFLFILLLLVSSTYQCGAVLHTIIAQKAMTSYMAANSAFKDVFSPNLNYYYSGAVFPDPTQLGCTDFGNYLHTQGFFENYAAYVRDACPISDISGISSLTTRCKQLYAHVYGLYSHLISDYHFHTFFLPVMQANDPLLFKQHQSSELLLDHYYTLYESPPFASVVLMDPISEINTMFYSKGIVEKSYALFTNRFCNAVYHAEIVPVQEELVKIWPIFGCGSTTSILGGISVPVTLADQESAMAKVWSVTSEALSLGLTSLEMQVAEDGASARSYTDIRSIIIDTAPLVVANQCPLLVALKWTLAHINDAAYDGSAVNDVKDSIDGFSRLTDFMLRKVTTLPFEIY